MAHLRGVHVRDGKIDQKWEHFDPRHVADEFLTHVGETLSGDV